MKSPTQREALESAIRAAELALFVIRKQGVMPNGSWARGFETDLAIAKAGLTDRQGMGGIDAVADAIDPERSPDGGGGMILCTMPECQTSAGCLCQRRGIISDPATVPSRDYVNMLKDEIEMLKEKVRLHCADAKIAWAECDAPRITAMKREEELTVSVKPLTWEHDGSRYHAYCRITDTRYVANNEGEKREREAGRATRILSALLSNPKPEAEPVGYADLGHIARKESAGSSVYPFPTGTCRSPLYAHPPNPEETDDWFSQIASFFVKHGMLDERDQYDISDIMAALADNYEPEATEGGTHRHKKRGSTYVLIGFGKMQSDRWQVSRDGFDQSIDMEEVAIYRSVDDGSLWVRPREEFEDGRFDDLRAAITNSTEGVDRQVHHSKPIASQNAQIVEDNATEVQAAERSCTCHPDDNPPIPCARKFAYSECVTEGGAHEKGIEAAAESLVYTQDATFEIMARGCIAAYRASLTAKQTDGREGECK